MMTTQEAPSPPVMELAPHFGDRARARAFAEFLESHRGETHIVAVQDFPDPDAISSAMAYRAMAAEYEIETDVVYEGRISHQENLALVNLLSIDLIRFGDSVPLDQYDGAVYIDNQGTTTRLADRLGEAGIPALAVIDHHAPQGVLQPEFTDVRPVGAAATIVIDYLRSGEIFELDPDDASHVKLATALVHGLRSETNAFVRAGTEELLAAAYLSRLSDPELLEGIMRVQRSHGTMDVIETALSDRLIRGGFSLAGVGYLRHADRDAIPQAADFLITEENVHTAIVYGIVQGEGERELVVGSIRTSKVTLDVDQFLKTALGGDAQGRYYGGGRERAGGFEIPVGFLSGTQDAEHMRLKWTAFNRQIRGKLLGAAGIEEEDEE